MWKIFLLLAMAHGEPAKFAYPPQRFSMKGVSQIQIVGVKGSLHLRGRRGKLMTLKVQHSTGKKTADDWNLSMERRGPVLFLEVANVTYGREWRKQVREDQWPEFDIDLEGPSLPTIVSWREGKLEFNQWDADLEVAYLKGQATVRGGRGSFKLQQVGADLNVQNRQGAVKVQGESGHLILGANTGDAQIEWLKGPIDVRDCRGKMQIDSGSSRVSVQGGRGELHVKLPSGEGRLAGFQGLVEAKGESSRWQIQASAPDDLNVTSLSGPVQLDWKGGAKFFLTSTRGSIEAPHFLKSSEREGQKVWTGTKTGAVMGQVFVRTGSGGILLQ